MESVHLAFLVAVLNNLKIFIGSMHNAYLNAPTTEIVYIVCGSEFGYNMDRPALIVKALYALKSSSARFRDHLTQSLLDLCFKIFFVDPDVWMI